MRRTGIVVVATLVAACSGEPSPGASAVPAAPATAPAPADAATPPAPADAGLAGTAWQLVQIMSMDDTTYVPQDGAKYTLSFGADGRASVRADCRTVEGTWQSATPGQVEFAGIEPAESPCPTDTLAGQYDKQFPWVRGYVLKDGRLFLSTMADGAIIEFQPAN